VEKNKMPNTIKDKLNEVGELYSVVLDKERDQATLCAINNLYCALRHSDHKETLTNEQLELVDKIVAWIKESDKPLLMSDAKTIDRALLAVGLNSIPGPLPNVMHSKQRQEIDTWIQERNWIIEKALKENGCDCSAGSAE
jgi:hypothetical protein